MSVRIEWLCSVHVPILSESIVGTPRESGALPILGLGIEDPIVAGDLRVELAHADDLSACYALRHLVFVVEQGVPVDLERDEHDPYATHWVARVADEVIGTARARAIGRDAKAERVAVLARARRLGVGRALMNEIEAWAAGQGLDRVMLNAQTDAVPFYRTLGYSAVGDVFDEAGIAHQAMCKRARDGL